MGVGSEAKVLDGLTGVLGTTEEDGVGASWGAQSKLIDGEELTTGGQDAGTGGRGETEGRNGELGDGQETVVVSDGADQDNGLALELLGSVLVGDGGSDTGDGHGRAVDLAHHKTAEDDGVELAVGTAFFRANKVSIFNGTNGQHSRNYKKNLRGCRLLCEGAAYGSGICRA